MSNFKYKKAKIRLAIVLIFVIVFNIITTKSYSATLDITTESTRIEGDFKFNYNLGFQDTMITSDFVLEFDSEYVEFLGTDTENVEYNQIENGKIIFLYVDETGNGTQNININFKIKEFEEKLSTQIKITDINAYSLTKGEAYTTKDYNLDKTVMTITTDKKENVKPNNNTNENTNNISDENTTNQNNSNIGDITNTSNGNSNTIPNDNTFSNDANENIDNVGTVTNNNGNNSSNNSNNNNTIKISTPNEDQKAVGALPFAGKTTSKIAIILLIILIAHSGISFAKYHKKETNIFMLFIVALILASSIDSNATGNIFIKNFDRIKNFEHLIVIMPDLENRNIKYSDFITIQKSNNINIVQVRNKKGEAIEVDDYISTGDIAQSNEKIGYKTVVYGDVNSDGNVNSNDIAEILVHKLNNVELDPVVKKAANLCNEDDVEDKIIDSNDIKVIKEYVLRTITGNLVQKLPEELAKGIKIIAEKTELNVGEEQKLSYTVEPAEKIVEDIIWTSSDENIAIVDEDGKVIAKSVGIAYITATSQSDSQLNDTITIEVISPVTGVKLTHKKLELEVGETRVIGAIVEPVEAKHREVLWSTSNSQIASVDENGKITALEEGKVTITATTQEGKFTDTCEVTVVEDDVISTPKDLYVREVVINKTYTVLTKGEKEKLEAFVIPANALDQSVYWETSDSDIVTVNQNGEIEAIDSGMAVITVVSNDGGYTASCVVIVDKVDVISISLNESKISINNGETADLIATVNPPNATNKEVIWTSSNELVVTVQNGKVTGVGPGIATISAKTKDGGHVAICTIQVAPINPTQIKLDKEEVNINVGKTSKLNATIEPENADNKTVIWESNNENVCTVDNFGNITAIKKGTATITAKTEEGNLKATCRVIVNEEGKTVTGISLNKNTLSLSEGATETLIATVLPENADNKQVTWKSSDESIATVDGSGKVTAQKAGTVTITVTTQEGNKSATCIVTVNRIAVHVTGVTINKTSLSLDKGATETLIATVLPENADNKQVTWKSSDESIATVDGNGKVTAQKAGTATITVTTQDGNKTATCTVTVKHRQATGIKLNKNSTKIYIGKTETLTATVEPDDADNKNVQWSSTDSSIAEVSNGVVTGKKAGTTIITAKTADGEYSAECTVTVEKVVQHVNSVTLNKTNIELKVNGTETLIATVNPENADNKQVTWKSSDESIATVDGSGKVTGKKAGTATITVTTQDENKTATCTVTVKEEINVSLSKTNIELNVNEETNIDILVTPEQGFSYIIHNTDNVEVQTNERKIKVTGKKAGTSKITITVTVDGKEYVRECNVTVKTNEIRPESVTLDKEQIILDMSGTNSTDLKASIKPENCNTDTDLSWSSANTNIATVDSNGKVTARANGTTTITVRTKNGKLATCSVAVQTSPQSITLSDTNITLDMSGTKEKTLTATIEPANCNVNTSLTWSSSNTNIATVDSNGKVTAKSNGTATITVRTQNGKTVACNVTVNRVPVRVTGISLNKTTLTLNEGATETLTATVAPANADNKQVTWNSSNTEVATVDGNGKVTTKKAGTAAITVITQDGNKTATCNVTVNRVPVRVTGVSLNKTTLTLNEGATETLTATVTPENADNKQVTWNSSNTEVATVDGNGKVTAKKAGTAAITVTTQDGNKTATCTVTVKETITVKLSKENIELEVGEKTELEIIIKPDNLNGEKGWKINPYNSSLLKVEKTDTFEKCEIEGLKEGTTTLNFEVTVNEQKFNLSCNVTVNKKVVSVTGVTLNKNYLNLKEDQTETLIATVTPNDANNKNVIWKSSNENIAIVNSDGNVTAIKEGTTEITVTTEDGKKIAICNVYVTVKDIRPKNILLDKMELTLDMSEEIKEEKLNAKFEPSNSNTDIDLTWISDNINIATVDSNGKVTAKSNGKAKITAQNKSGISVTCSVTVQTSPTSIKILPGETTVTGATAESIAKSESLTLKYEIEPQTADANTEIKNWYVKRNDTTYCENGVYKSGMSVNDFEVVSIDQTKKEIKIKRWKYTRSFRRFV